MTPRVLSPLSFRTYCAGLLGALMSAACSDNLGVDIESDFESGSLGEVVSASGSRIVFDLDPDPGGGERLWFYFTVRAAEPVQPEFIIANSSEAHQHNWDVVRPVFSSDGEHWERAIDTVSPGQAGLMSGLADRVAGRPAGFKFRAPFAAREFSVAYSKPYTRNNLERYLATVTSDLRVQRSVIGQTEHGRPLPLVTVVEDASVSRNEIWVVAREHPGETPASWVLEGFLSALLDSPAGTRLLADYRFRIVPTVNVDGVADGLYYRTPAGIDLAQDWGEFRSAESAALHDAMRGALDDGLVALVINLHSANAPKSHFVLETPSDKLKPNLAELQRRLIEASAEIHPQLQTSETIQLWDHPEIFGNYLSSRYGVYCLYVESNYSVGADGSTVTTDSLTQVGAGLVRALATLHSENQLPIRNTEN